MHAFAINITHSIRLRFFARFSKIWWTSSEVIGFDESKDSCRGTKFIIEHQILNVQRERRRKRSSRAYHERMKLILHICNAIQNLHLLNMTKIVQ